MKRFWKHTLALTLIAPALVLAPSTGAEAKRLPDPVSNGVHVIGDSITRGVHLSALSERNRPKGWTVDAYGGRHATALTARFIRPTDAYHPATQHPFRIERAGHGRVSTVVLALGTNNPVDLTAREARRLYADAVRRMRAMPMWNKGPKRVVLVTAFRAPYMKPGNIDPGTGIEYGAHRWASRATTMTKAMAHVAKHTKGVCLAHWRKYIQPRHRWATTDGVHPTQHGRKMWRNIVFKAVRACR